MTGISGVGQGYSYSPMMRAGDVRRANPTEDAGNVYAAGRHTGGTAPVERVRPVPIVRAGASNGIPFLRKGADPAELAVRMRMEDAGEESGVEGARKALEEGECQTCKERKYQDGSDDPGVSYQTPTRISPQSAASAVRGHEMEHVVRENAKAQREDRKVVSQSVTLHTAICPECGDVYVSGGTTRTTTAAKDGLSEAEAGGRPEEYRPFSAVA